MDLLTILLTNGEEEVMAKIVRFPGAPFGIEQARIEDGRVAYTTSQNPNGWDATSIQAARDFIEILKDLLEGK
jgi:hypothetical protein